jgi:hypothetical protein
MWKVFRRFARNISFFVASYRSLFIMDTMYAKSIEFYAGPQKST